MKLKASKNYFRRLKKIFKIKVEWWEFSIKSEIRQVQKTVFIGKARILRKVLGI